MNFIRRVVGSNTNKQGGCCGIEIKEAAPADGQEAASGSCCGTDKAASDTSSCCGVDTPASGASSCCSTGAGNNNSSCCG